MTPMKTTKVDLDGLLDGLIERVLSGSFSKIGPLWAQDHGSGRLPRNLTSGRRYQGINALTLMLAASDQGYKSPCWTTVKQCNTIGGHIRKGETCQYVVVWSPRDRTKKNEDGTEEKTKTLFCRLHAVFNYDQTTLSDNEAGPAPDSPDVLAPPDHLTFLRDRVLGLGVSLREDADGAWYSPPLDILAMPAATRFFHADDYSAVFAHEAIHATGHPTRLDRDQKGRGSDKGAYAFEELIAELGSAFLCAELGISGTYDAHESYLAGWSKLFQDRKRSLLTAASAASKAFELIMTGELPIERTTHLGEGSQDRDGTG